MCCSRLKMCPPDGGVCAFTSDHRKSLSGVLVCLYVCFHFVRWSPLTHPAGLLGCCDETTSSPAGNHGCYFLQEPRLVSRRADRRLVWRLLLQPLLPSIIGRTGDEGEGGSYNKQPSSRRALGHESEETDVHCGMKPFKPDRSGSTTVKVLLSARS